MRSPSVALVTCARHPDLHEDDRPLLGALAERGVEAVPAVWNDLDVDWNSFDLAVLRNPWDYIDHFEEFLAWIQSVPRLANPAPVVVWNVDKRYLGEVAAAGVPVIPTTYVAPGEAAPPMPAAEVVVKPTVSAGSRDTIRTADADRYAAQVDLIHASGRVAMVQPYLAAVDEVGETAVIFLGGEHSHAARKGPLLPLDRSLVEGLYAEEQMSARVASPVEVEVARAALAAVPGGEDLLYARVDLIPEADGQPVVLEIEVTEPSLFLELGDAADRFAAAIAAALPTP